MTKEENEKVIKEKIKLLDSLYTICEKKCDKVKEDPYILDKAYARGATVAYGSVMHVIREMKTSILHFEKTEEEKRNKYEEGVKELMNSLGKAFSNFYFTLREETHG